MLTSCPRRQWRPDAEISRLWVEPTSRIHLVPRARPSARPSLLPTTPKTGWSCFCASPVHEVSTRGARGALSCSELPRELGRPAGCARAPSFIHPTDPAPWSVCFGASAAACSLLLVSQDAPVARRHRAAGDRSCVRRADGRRRPGLVRGGVVREVDVAAVHPLLLLLAHRTALLVECVGRLPARLHLPLGPSPAAAALLERHGGSQVMCLAGEYIIIIIITHGREAARRAALFCL